MYAITRSTVHYFTLNLLFSRSNRTLIHFGASASRHSNHRATFVRTNMSATDKAATVPEKEEPIGLFPGVDEDEDEEDEFLMDGQEHEGADPDTRADGAPASSSRPRSNRQKGKTSEEMRFWIPPFIDVDNLPGPRVTPDGRPISWWKRINKKSLTEEQWDQIRIWRNKCKSKRTKENRTHRINNEILKLKEDHNMSDEQVTAYLAQWKQEQKANEATMKAKLATALTDDFPFKVVIDCSFIESAVEREKKSLIKQIEHSVVANRKGPEPLYLGVTGYAGTIKAIGDKMSACRWPMRIYERPTLEVFPRESLVILSPDATEPLTALEPGKVYVIGGIVDRTVKKNETREFAELQGNLPCRRLPIAEHVEVEGVRGNLSKHPKMQVLNINEVFEALLHIHNQPGDWPGAMDRAVPSRKKRLVGPTAELPEGHRPVKGRPIKPLLPAPVTGGNGAAPAAAVGGVEMGSEPAIGELENAAKRAKKEGPAGLGDDCEEIL